MPEGKTLEASVEKIMQRLRSVNLLYIRKIAMQIRKIGELGQASVNRLVAMADMNADIGEITERLRRITAVNNRTLQKVFLRAMNEQYTDSRFGRYLAKYPLKNAQRQRIEHYVQAVYRQTAGTLANLSNTTAVTMRQAYIGAIDSAILAASTGVASYTETMRDTLRQIGRAGMQVRYASGYRRRLDTAVRQNIVDGINQISKNASVMIGEEINRQAGSDVYDAIEISAHARSAPDHEPVQGHVFMKAEWEKLQAGLVSRDIDGRVFAGFRRPIGEWNCRHTPMSFSTKWSKRKWTDEQLRKFIDENRQGCTIDGKHRTLYEAMQMMREIETAVRREKDTAVAAQAAGDDALRQQCQRNINALVRRYAEIAKASGNAEKRERMTVEGFRQAKILDKSEKDAIMSVEEWYEKYKPLKSDKTVPALRKESEKWIESLSSEEKRAITKYSRNPGDEGEEKFYYRLNSMLSGKMPSDLTLKYYADTISSALSKFTLKHAIICYRSVASNPLQGLSVGDVYAPDQYISTSVTSKGALDKDFKMVILAAPGSNGAYIEKLSEYPKQREFLFNDKCRYAIMELDDDSAVLGVII